MSRTSYHWLDNGWLCNYRVWFWDNYWLRFDNNWLWFCWLKHRFRCWLDNRFDHNRCRFHNYWFGRRFMCRFGYRSWFDNRFDNRFDNSRLLFERFWLLNYWLGQRCWFDHSWCWFLSDRLWLGHRSWLDHDWFWLWFWFWFWFWCFDNNGCWFDNRLDNSRFGFFRNLGSRLGSRYNLDFFFFFPSSSSTTSVCITSLFTRLFFWLWGTSLFFPVIFIIISTSSTATSASS